MTMISALLDGLDAFTDQMDPEPDETGKEWSQLRAQARDGNPWLMHRYLWGGRVVLDDFHEDIIQSINTPAVRDVYAKGNAGCGKGAGAAQGVIIWFLAHDNCKVVITRDTERSARQVMFGEIRKWWKRMDHQPSEFVMTETRLTHRSHREQWQMTIANPMLPEGFAGGHAANVLHLYDEATARVLEQRFDLTDTQATKHVCLGNPRTTAGRFRKAWRGVADPNKSQTVKADLGMRRLITISGKDCTNVKKQCLEKPIGPLGGITIDGQRFEHGDRIPKPFHDKCKPIIPGQVTYDQWKMMAAKPKRFADIFAHGLFPDEDPELQLIYGLWLDRATEYWRKWHRLEAKAVEYDDGIALKGIESLLPIEAGGLDCAASADGDYNCLTCGGSAGAHEQYLVRHKNTQLTVQWVIDTFDSQYGIDLTRGGLPIAVDYGGGFGNAIGDPLASRGVRVLKVHPSASPDSDDNKKVWLNMRVQLLAQLAARLDPDGAFIGQVPWMIPDDDELLEELTAVQKIFRAGDALKFGLTPKRPTPGQSNEKFQSLQQMLGRSPDKCDSLALLYYATKHKGMSLGDWLNKGAF